MKTAFPRALAAVSPLLLVAGCATVPAATGDPAIGQAPISIDTMKEVTRTLSSDAFEGREPGTRGEELTLAYLVEQFAAAGLQPGNRGSWFQDVPLVEITGSEYAPLRVGDNSFEYAKDWVGVSYRQVDRTVIEESPLVFVGYGINAPERGWNDYEGIDMRGKTALILVNDPDYSSDSLEGTFNGRAMTYYGRWTYKYEEAARQGATAAIIVHDTFPASYGWNVVESSWSGPQAYADTGGDGSDQTKMNGWVTKDAARKIFADAGLDIEAMIAAAARPGFAAVDLRQTVSTGFANTSRSFSSKNLVAMLPGTTRPDEVVLHTAHWDHLGRCTANAAGDDICNGAIDNATGTAALVALGEAHARAGATARSQVFLAVTAEESGLLGAQYYASDPVFPLAQTVGGVNMDALYVMGPAADVVTIGGGKSELDDVLARALAGLGRTATPDPEPQAGYYYRSDHFALAKRGVPMLYVKPGQELVNGGRAAAQAYAEDYRANAYHGPDDEYDPNWDWSGIAADLQLYFALGRALGQSDEWPNWRAGDEFRSIRDKTCAPAGGC